MTTELQLAARSLKRAQDRNHRALDRALAAVGTTLVQWDALRCIDEAPASSAHELAVATFQSDQAFGTLATRLIEQGLVTRAPGHGRRLEHRLTTAGKRVLREGNEVWGSWAKQAFAKLSRVEVQQLHALLERVSTP